MSCSVLVINLDNVNFCVTYCFSCRDCTWLPNEFKEEYLQSVKEVEKAVLRAVISFGLYIYTLGMFLLSGSCIICIRRLTSK